MPCRLVDQCSQHSVFSQNKYIYLSVGCFLEILQIVYFTCIFYFLHKQLPWSGCVVLHYFMLDSKGKIVHLLYGTSINTRYCQTKYSFLRLSLKIKVTTVMIWIFARKTVHFWHVSSFCF